MTRTIKMIPPPAAAATGTMDAEDEALDASAPGVCEDCREASLASANKEERAMINACIITAGDRVEHKTITPRKRRTNNQQEAIAARLLRT